MKKVKPKLKVGLVYSPAMGGNTVESIRMELKKQGADVRNLDFRVMSMDSDPRDPEVRSKAKEYAREFLKDKDCLVLPGNGRNIDPYYYTAGKNPNFSNRSGPNSSNNLRFDHGRTIMEQALIEEAILKGIPTLGICAGHQILNVAFGGAIKNVAREQKEHIYDTIIIDPKSMLAKAMKPQQPVSIVETYGAHQRAIDEKVERNRFRVNENGKKPGEDYFDTVAHTKGGVSVEAIESKYGVPIFGLQFHPEVPLHGIRPFNKHTKKDLQPENRAFFSAFLEIASQYSKKKKVIAEIAKKGYSEEEIDRRKVAVDRLEEKLLNNRQEQEKNLSPTELQIARIDNILRLRHELAKYKDSGKVNLKPIEEELSQIEYEFLKNQKLDKSLGDISNLLGKNLNTVARKIEGICSQGHVQAETQEDKINFKAVLLNLPLDQWDRLAKAGNLLARREVKPTYKKAIQDFFNKIVDAFNKLRRRNVKDQEISDLMKFMRTSTENTEKQLKAENKAEVKLEDATRTFIPTKKFRQASSHIEKLSKVRAQSGPNHGRE
jgi:gamma-glutamyl-gamma-aminobutyrate hydrolase PuuD